MAITLEELQKQRQQVQAHLHWLDAKIAEQSTLAHDDTPTVSTSPAQNSEDAESNTSIQLEKQSASPKPFNAKPENESDGSQTASPPPLPSGAQIYTPPTEYTPPTKKSPTSVTEPPYPLESATSDFESTYKPKTQNDILRAKIGCLALFIVAVCMFLFFLFGLPYLL
ncbi:hypothetical protein QEH59_10785 [Coraliomargarita sp. SDUM461004]|uniref:Uncharacterized protein n=1 Tax=Thalassobacterium sedimentorum TaxID=3041258 RepID=A0ABU1AJU8_9BACT|nr:hypothetical protein [Coraliomargarita sp. SDUM461004]MDQ8194914.1 hypothetical protein [Coraliomargarita sp. SDUM461004]